MPNHFILRTNVWQSSGSGRSVVKRSKNIQWQKCGWLKKSIIIIDQSLCMQWNNVGIRISNPDRCSATE